VASTARSILSQIKTIFEAVDGPASYNYALDGGGQVLIGDVDQPPVANVAFVSFWLEEYESEAIDVGVNTWVHNMTVRVRGWVPGADVGSEARILAAVDLMSDLSEAIRADLTLGATAADADVVGIATFDGEDNHGIAWGACLLDVRATYFSNTGAL